MLAATIIQQRRFTNEKILLAKEPLHYTTAYSDKDNSLIWYCLIIGQKETPYHGGHYVYKVVHSPKYPAEPPDYYFLTPSGRYEVDKKICLTNSSYHKGEWSSTWNIKTILISFYSIFLDENEHGISHRHDSHEICKNLAKKSIEYNKIYHAEIYNKFDFTHLSDDAPIVNKIKNTASATSTASIIPTSVPIVPVTNPIVPITVPVVSTTVPVVSAVAPVLPTVVPVLPVVDNPVLPVVDNPILPVVAIGKKRANKNIVKKKNLIKIVEQNA